MGTAAGLAIALVLAVRSQTSLEVGYTLITADTGTVLPVGTALFSYTNPSGVLISQAGVGAAQPALSGRIFVDEAGTRTGIALVNPSPSSASIALVLRDAAGKEIQRATQTLAAGRHMARYVFELFPNLASGFTGSMTFESDQKIAAITLRESRNARQEPLYTTLPVVGPDTTTPGASVVFPQIAAGDGYTTQLVLLNTTGQKLAGQVTLTGSDGKPLALRLGNVIASQFAFEIDAQGSYRAEFDRPAGIASGYAVVTASAGSPLPAGTAIFQFKRNGSIVTEAGVAATPATTSARIFVDNAGSFTGLAVCNPSDQAAALTFTLLDRHGAVLDSATRTVAAKAHIALFAHELFPNLASSFTGLMDVKSTIAVNPITLKQTDNTRGDQVLTTLPVADHTRPPTATSLVFPQIAVGEGFSTRLILINAATAAAASGKLAFYQSDGSALVVPMGSKTDSRFDYQLAAGGGRQFLPGNTSKIATISLLDPGSARIVREVTVNEGQQLRPQLLVVDAAGSARDDFDVSFTSLDAGVATVDASGTIQGKKAGFSTLTLASGSVVATATISVVSVSSGSAGYEITGVVQDLSRRLYLTNSTENTILLAQDVTQAPALYAGVPKSAGLKNDLRLQSLFSKPAFMALHQAQGNLYVTDGANHAIRKAQPGPAGRLETLSGTGAAGSRDGRLQEASFNNPQGVVLDPRGNLWVVDSGNHTIRRINLTAGTVETIAGKGGTAGWVDGKGDAARFSAPIGIALETESRAQQIERERKGIPIPPVSMIVADTGNGALRRVKETGEVETLRASVPNVFDAATAGSRRRAAATAPATFSSPTGVAVDSSGSIYVSESTSDRVRVLLSNGEVVGAAQANTFASPRGIAIGASGRVVVSDRNRTAREIVYGQPEITRVTPDRISIRGGATVTIQGTNFAEDTVVIAAGVVIPEPVIVDTQTITFTAPALPTGRGTVTVQNRGGLAQASLLVDPVPLTQLPTGYITTVAGGTTYAGDGSKATAARLRNPGAAIIDAAGNLYIADYDGNRIRRVDARSGTITTVAGTGRFGFSGDSGPAIAANLNTPNDVALDSAGNLYICDTYNDRIRKVSASTGIITTVAGNGSWGYSGDGGRATDAELGSPYGIAIDAADNLWIADSDNNVIRRVDAATGRITTVAGTSAAGYSGDNGPATGSKLNYPYDVVVDSSGNAYVADYENQRIRKIAAATGVITTVVGNGKRDDTGDGGPATSAALYDPTGVAIDTSGNLLIAQDLLVRKVSAQTGIISTVAGNGDVAFSGDGGPATSAAIGVISVAVDAADDLFISDYLASRVRRVDARTGIINTVAGNGDTNWGDNGPAIAAQFYYPYGIALDAAGNLFIADTENQRIRKVTAATGVITTVAGSGRWGDSGDGGPAALAAFRRLFDVAVDPSGNLFIPDTENSRIRKVTATTGRIETLAGSGDEGFSGDGGAATAARFDHPYGIALDSAGNLYIADTENQRIRKVTAATGVITTVAGNGKYGFSGDGGPATAAMLAEPDAVAVDAVGNLYIVDTDNNRIRRVAAATGVITTVAGNGDGDFYGDGGPATSAALWSPRGVALDSGGNLYIADTYNNRIRRVAAATGVITTVAGNGFNTYSGDNGPAGSASLNIPSRVAIDAAGNLIVVDWGNERIRAVRGPVR
jgi:sugar lactone lactonase YvrE